MSGMPARFFSAIFFSMAVHLLFWSGFFGHVSRTSDRSKASLLENSVFIDPAAMEAVRKAKAKARAAAEPKIVQAAPVKKSQAPPPPPKAETKADAPAVPAPDKVAAPAPAAKSRAAEFAAAVARMPEKPSKEVLSAAQPAAVRNPGTVAAKTGADLMANPQTRGLFTDYFGQVKSRIQQKLREKCAGRDMGQGSVDLAFILLADGRLHKVYVMERTSSADSQLKQLAIQSLRESAPFVDFPADFNARQIAFNLTVYFDEL